MIPMHDPIKRHCYWHTVMSIGLLTMLLASDVETLRPSNQTVGKVYFKLNLCPVTKRAQVDPIRFPGAVGMSHSHEFFGNTAVDHNTRETSQLLQGKTSCQNPGAKSAYWIPTLYVYNKALNKYFPSKPRVITVYYFNKYHGSLRKTKPYPNGMKIICGDQSATGPQPQTVVEWFCSEDSEMQRPVRRYSNFPPCCQRLVVGRIYCPSCWNGRDLDSWDHKSHLRYQDPVTTKCPPSHPVQLPGIHMTVTYNVTGSVGWPMGGLRNKTHPPPIRLSTINGAGWQFHADVWEAWDPPTMKTMMEECFYKGQMCGWDGTVHTDLSPRKKGQKEPPLTSSCGR